jgi:hypothetical protein
MKLTVNLLRSMYRLWEADLLHREWSKLVGLLVTVISNGLLIFDHIEDCITERPALEVVCFA